MYILSDRTQPDATSLGCPGVARSCKYDYTMLCYTMLCYTILCYAMLFYTILCYIYIYVLCYTTRLTRLD